MPVVVLKPLPRRHAHEDEPLVDAVGKLVLHVGERAVDERVRVTLGKAVVQKPREGQRQQECRQHAEHELEVQTAAGGHFAPPSAITALAAASTSGLRLSTATPYNSRVSRGDTTKRPPDLLASSLNGTAS